MGLIFRMLFDENVGLVNELVTMLGGSRLPWLTSTTFSKIPVIILNVWRYTPWFTMILLSGLLNISKDYYEAATVDGANGWQQFWFITLPSLKNILFFCSVTLTVDMWKLFNESYILPGPGTSNSSPVSYTHLDVYKRQGIISNSGLKDTLINLVEVSGVPGYILAPLSGIVMGGATASCVAGATVASQVFGPTILSLEVTAVQAAVMIHAGCCVFDCLPHGSFFHISAGTLQLSIKERLKIIPYESLSGLGMTVVATFVYGVLGLSLIHI